ncbi:MAG: hypothetical protein R2822_20265 [Spirosomataceae bacterium]
MNTTVENNSVCPTCHKPMLAAGNSVVDRGLQRKIFLLNKVIRDISVCSSEYAVRLKDLQALKEEFERQSVSK